MKYRTIVCDPPWPYPEGFATVLGHPHKQERDKGIAGGKLAKTTLPYQSLTLRDIAALPIGDISEQDCRLFLWATMRYLPDALGMLPGWGFAYKQLIVWDKTGNFSLGGSVAPNTAEFLLVAARGKPARMNRWATSVVRARKARTEHSRKPDVFLDLAETVSPGPYLELFARRQRLGWDTWGNEALSHVEMPA